MDEWMSLIFYQIIRIRNLEVGREIGSGPGYFIHTGEIKGRAVIVKVFNASPSAREVFIGA